MIVYLIMIIILLMNTKKCMQLYNTTTVGCLSSMPDKTQQ